MPSACLHIQNTMLALRLLVALLLLKLSFGLLHDTGSATTTVDRRPSPQAAKSSRPQQPPLLPLAAETPVRTVASYYSRHGRDYKLLKEIGRGSEGIVYLANYITLPPGTPGKSVAIKRFTNAYAHWPLPLPIWQVEYDLARRFPGHPNIMQPLALVYFNDRHTQRQPVNMAHQAIVYELMPTDLFKSIHHSAPFSMRQIQSFMRDLLTGLDAIHTLGIIHRDIKPSNCLIGHDGRLKLADFGAAMPLYYDDKYHMTRMSSNVVTAWYRAPELHMGSQFYTGAVDIFAAGLILWELLFKDPLLKDFAEQDLVCGVIELLGGPHRFYFPGQQDSMYMTQLPFYQATRSHCTKRWLPVWTHLRQVYGWRAVTPNGVLTRPLEHASMLGLHPIHKAMYTTGGPLVYDLFSKMTHINQFQRPSARALLQHPFFSTQF